MKITSFNVDILMQKQERMTKHVNRYIILWVDLLHIFIILINIKIDRLCINETKSNHAIFIQKILWIRCSFIWNENSYVKNCPKMCKRVKILTKAIIINTQILFDIQLKGQKSKIPWEMFPCICQKIELEKCSIHQHSYVIIILSTTLRLRNGKTKFIP